MLRSRLPLALLLLFVLSLSLLSLAQENPQGWKNELYGGYSHLSSSFTDNQDYSGGGLNGWNAAFARHALGRFGWKIAVLGYYGTSAGNTVIEHSIVAGPQYAKPFGRESVFIHGLIGIGFINSGAFIPQNSPTSNATLAALAGGGLDTPISPRLALRLEVDYLHTQYSSSNNQIHGLHGNFASISTGVVWRF